MTNIIDQVQACQKAASNAQAARARAEHELGVAQASKQAVEQQLQTEFGVGISDADALLATLEQRLSAELDTVRQQLAGTQGG